MKHFPNLGPRRFLAWISLVFSFLALIAIRIFEGSDAFVDFFANPFTAVLFSFFVIGNLGLIANVLMGQSHLAIRIFQIAELPVLALCFYLIAQNPRALENLGVVGYANLGIWLGVWVVFDLTDPILTTFWPRVWIGK